MHRATFTTTPKPITPSAPLKPGTAAFATNAFPHPLHGLGLASIAILRGGGEYGELEAVNLEPL